MPAPPPSGTPRVLLLALALAVGCGAPTDDAATDTASTTPEAPSGTTTDAPLDLPETITETITVEGEPQETTLHLVREDDALLPFATYRPADLAYESVASGEGGGYRFTFGDPPYDASLHVFFPQADELDAPAAYAQAVAGEGVALEPMGDTAPWVEAAYRWYRDGRVGSVLAGTHAGRRFYVIEDLPEEMGDGFAPRVATILSRWRWLPEGAELE